MAAPFDSGAFDSTTFDTGGATPGGTEMILSGGTTWEYARETFTLTCGESHFKQSDADEDSEIHFFAVLDDEGKVATRLLKLEIIDFTSDTVVTVRANHDVPVAFRDTPITAWGHARKHIIGLGHLEGKTVAALADAHVHPQVVVTAGAIDLQYCACVIHVGLPYDSDFE